MAVGAFGSKAVQTVVGSAEFAETYPALSRQLQSGDVGTRSHTLLPAETMLAIAGRDDCIKDFWEAPERDYIRCWPVDQAPVGSTRLDEACPPKRWIKLHRQEALKTYGAFALFRAVDASLGSKREHDYDRDLYAEREALRLTIASNKRSFVLSEPVLVWVRLRNTAAVPIRIYGYAVMRDPAVHPVLHYLSFYLTTPAGSELLAPITKGKQISYEEGTDMQPGEAVTQSFDLRSFYRLQEPGRYRLLTSHSRASRSSSMEFDIQVPNAG